LSCRCDVVTGHSPGFAIDLWHENDFGTECFEHLGALRTVAGRHRNDQRMANARTNNGEPGAHISTGHFDDRRSRFQTSVSTRGVHNGASGSILNAAARLQEFRLCEYTARAFPYILQLDDACTTDQV
jgi:hypothetical protein